jgi:hypothetical protein
VYARLVDPFGRAIEYVRLSVTDRSKLRCRYCLPEGFRDFQEPAEWLGFNETERIMRAFAGLGVRRVRLTGGEPLTSRAAQGCAAAAAAVRNRRWGSATGDPRGHRTHAATPRVLRTAAENRQGRVAPAG